jgi:L-ribulose-5-phosphate 4-epimerase
MLETLREQVWQLHLELPKNQLVTWTGGNVSARDPQTGYVVIKPSGVRYEALNPAHLVIVDLQGKRIEGDLQPSSDTASHLYIYRHRQDVNGVVHTHSPYATAFAALGMPIPVCLTAMADEFGGPIPCGRFALIGGEEIGQVVVESIGDSPAVLLKNHGVFTVGRTAEAAVKAAVMVEDVARTVWIARQLGQPDDIPPEEVAKLHRRYRSVYGQSSPGALGPEAWQGS